MTEPLVSPPPLPPPPARVVPEPSFWRAWQGLWSLTWKSQLLWRRTPILLATLLTVPLLMYFTLEPLKLLTGDYDWRQRPREMVNEFRAEAGGLSRGISQNLTQIIRDEQDQVIPAEPNVTADGGNQFTEQALEQEKEKVRACQARIAERARSVLNPTQFAAFERFQARKLEEAASTIRRFNLRDLRPFYSWLFNFYFFLALPLYCLLACGSMIRDELQADTLGFLTTRPVGRGRLFLMKYLCQMLWLQAVVAVHGLLLISVGWVRQVPGMGELLPFFLGVQFLAVLSWGALSALLGIVTRRYMVLGIAYGFIVELGLGRIPTNINVISLTRHFRSLLGHHPVLQQLSDWVPQDGRVAVSAVLLATGIFLALGIGLFTHREYHHATEMQK